MRAPRRRSPTSQATTGARKACWTRSTCTWWCRPRGAFGIPAIADSLDKVIADYGINLHGSMLERSTAVGRRFPKVAVGDAR